MDVCNLRYDVHQRLCQFIDKNNEWKKLAQLMNFDASEIRDIEKTSLGRNKSAADALLLKWSSYNHNLDELFALLFRTHNVDAMKCLKDYITDRLKEKYEHFIQVAEKIRRTEEKQNQNEAMTLNSVLQIPEIPYQDLLEATNNWSEANHLGKGGFGAVYKGKWKENYVAIKRLNEKALLDKDLIRELSLNRYRHDNILPLYGFSRDGKEPCLVYQLMNGGSLYHRLRCANNAPPLTWSQRKAIACGVAKGLYYLHNYPSGSLIHGDIKPANILLNDCGTPIIGDFGLAKSRPKFEAATVSRVEGTPPYLPLEYLKQCVLSPAVDVYSFGVVLLELATSAPPLTKTRHHKLLRDHIHSMPPHFYLGDLEDPKLKGTVESNPIMCEEFIKLGIVCTASDMRRRPTMLQVYKNLESL